MPLTRTRPRVLLVDDHRLILNAVRRSLEESGDFEIVGEATSVDEVMPQIRRTQPDAVLLDIRMAGSDGLLLLDRIRQSRPKIKVVVLSVLSDPMLVEDALERGASGYIVKSVSPIDLPGLIRGIVGEARAAGPTTQTEVADRPAAAGLTTRELAVLTLLADGLPNDAIAGHLSVATHTVKFHLSSIYRKLGVANRTEAALYAYQRGLVDGVTPGSDSSVG
jgi:DNA-binding NarL/FixJ family response regulator